MTNSLGYMGKFLRSVEKPSVFRKLAPFPSAIITTQKTFPDVSFYQGTINWDKMRIKTDAVIIRAGQNLWIDTQFVRNWSEAKRVGMRRGVYWFYDDRKNPYEQASLLLSLIRYDLPEMEIIADWENTYGGAYNHLTNVIQFLQVVGSALPAAKLGIYTGYYWFKDHTAGAPQSEYDYVKQKRLWLAWYTSNPSYVQIPAPWTKLTHWQFGTPAVGAEYGVQTSEIDMNWFNGSTYDFYAEYPSTTSIPEEHTNPHPGIDYYKFRRYGTTIHVAKVNLAGKRFFVRYGFAKLGDVTQDTLFGCNGDGWNSVEIGKPNSVCYSNGQAIQSNQWESSPWLDVSSDNKASMNWQNPYGLYNAVSGDRFLVIDGHFNDAIWERTTKNARTAVGMIDESNLVFVVADGDDTKNIGATFPEMAETLISYGCNKAISLDGGGSSVMRVMGQLVSHPNDDDFYGPSVERSVVNQILIYAAEPPTGEPMTRVIQGTVLTTVKVRESPAGIEIPNIYLYANDRIEASENSSQWLHLSKVNGVDVDVKWPTVATKEKWSSAGSSQQYIKWDWVDVPSTDPVPPPPTPVPSPLPDTTNLTVVFDDLGITYKGTLTKQ